MISRLDFNAYALKIFFNFFGKLGSSILNFGITRGLDVFSDLRYGIEPEQRLDIFRPKASDRQRLPVLVYFHGGGWISADKSIYKGIAANFAKNGFLTVNVNYRLAPKSRFPAPLQDAIHAIDWVSRNAASYGGDPENVALAGDSAGAQIASWYASAARGREFFYDDGNKRLMRKVALKGLVLFYGVYDFDTVQGTGLPFIKTYARSFLGAEKRIYAENSRISSSIMQINNQLPPIWICAGEKDGLFPQSQAYAEALRGNGISCQTLFFSSAQRANHGFLFFRWLECSKVASAAAIEFLRDCVSQSRGLAP